jgi:transposase-like protein
MGRKGVPHRRFTPEFKVKVVKENLDAGKSIEILASQYEIEPRLLRQWRTTYLAQGAEGLAAKPKGRPSESVLGRPQTVFETELERLRYENARLQMENLMLKKLHDYLRGDGSSRKKR